MPENATFPSLCADLLKSGQPVRFRASGASMGPTIRDGDLLTVVPIGNRGIRREDVILYSSERGLTAHRVVEFQPGAATFITMGDAPGSPREPVEAGAVLGRVESVEREGVRLPIGGPFGRHAGRLIWLARRARLTVGR